MSDIWSSLHHGQVFLSRRCHIAKVLGNIEGLKASELKGLQRLYGRRYPVQGGYSIEQARELAALSRVTGRQIALLLDRQGRPEMVIAGEPSSIFIPELSRTRQTQGRLRGLRILHTHLSDELLSQEDLMDMLFLRLDSFSVLTVNQYGEPLRFQTAHLLPPNPENDPYRIFDPVAWDRVDIDFAAQTLALEEELARTVEAVRETGPSQGAVASGTGRAQRAVLVSVSTQPRVIQEQCIEELKELARSAGVECAGTMIQRVQSMNPRHILGKGKLAELEVLALRGNADLIVFDDELLPAQLAYLADITERKVLDRTQLILDVFAQRASTKAGKLQVEMAQLKYALPRLAGSGRNRAFDRLAGGIGGRGPGETKLETDRRKIRDRIARIKGELDALRRQRAFVRARRAKTGIPLASLVGYTNAGKSTLLNVLTKSEVLAADKLFATLDTTTRRLRVPDEREVILADTVGFIRKLPKELKEAFRATLEELEAADLFIHVADASHPDLDRQIAAVSTILDDLELGNVPTILVLNKWDRVAEEEKEGILERYPGSQLVSALRGENLDGLAQAIASRIDWENAGTDFSDGEENRMNPGQINDDECGEHTA